MFYLNFAKNIISVFFARLFESNTLRYHVRQKKNRPTIHFKKIIDFWIIFDKRDSIMLWETYKHTKSVGIDFNFQEAWKILPLPSLFWNKNWFPKHFSFYLFLLYVFLQVFKIKQFSMFFLFINLCDEFNEYKRPRTRPKVIRKKNKPDLKIETFPSKISNKIKLNKYKNFIFYFFKKIDIKNFKIFFQTSSLINLYNKNVFKKININFLRKNKFFNKGRYSRNRQYYRTGVYWCLYINIIAVLGFYFWFYKITLNFGYLWWLLWLFFASFFLPKFFKYINNRDFFLFNSIAIDFFFILKMIPLLFYKFTSLLYKIYFKKIKVTNFCFNIFII